LQLLLSYLYHIPLGYKTEKYRAEKIKSYD
jgi:hypothetical protein